MVGAAIDDAGEFWIVGDTLGGETYPAQDLSYQAWSYQRLDEWASRIPPKPLWRNGLPWSAA
jgi:hypothetical protein